MLSIFKKYRASYYGEDIVVDRNYTDGIWHDTTERVPNNLVNNQISNRAVVIGNGPSRLDWPLRIFNNRNSGLLGSKKVQTYGCNGLYRDFAPDFLIATGDKIVDEIAASNYHQNHIVYTSSIHTLEHPGKFYLIPFDPYTDAGTTAMYIAAFDGHKKIYLLGFDNQTLRGKNNNIYAGTSGYDAKDMYVGDAKWIHDRKVIFDLYNDVEFILVANEPMVLPEPWKYCSNLRQLDYRWFKKEADL